MNLGASELMLVLVVVLLLFGGKRLPELARSIGKGLAEFRRASQAIRQEINAPLKDPPPAKPTPPESTSSAPDAERNPTHGPCPSRCPVPNI